MKSALIVLACCLSLPALAQDSPQVKVTKAAEGLFQPNHRVLIADEAQWSTMSERLHLDTDNAFTNLDTHLTIIRGRFVQKASPDALRHVLGHEAGHVRCNCFDEATAEFWARAHL